MSIMATVALKGSTVFPMIPQIGWGVKYCWTEYSVCVCNSVTQDTHPIVMNVHFKVQTIDS